MKIISNLLLKGSLIKLYYDYRAINHNESAYEFKVMSMIMNYYIHNKPLLY